jgi:hypothetical protein
MRVALRFTARLVAGVAPALAAWGCWKGEYAQIPPGAFRFQPEFAGAPADWSVAPIDVGLSCPDDESAPMYLLYPDASAEEGSEPLPVALLFVSGAFDFVYAPDPGSPLLGTHFAEPPRLTASWAIDHVFVTLGMSPDRSDREIHDGRLPAALASRGVAVLLPANCWGDLWANDRALHPNDFAADFFFRDGRSSAAWSHGIVSDPAFAEAFDVVLPVPLDPARVFAVGLGEGGRAVAELLSLDGDGDGAPDRALAGALVDSPPDDLRPYFDDPGLYGPTVEGLSRIFPDGPAAAEAGSLWAAPLPERFGLVWSPADPVLVPGALEALLGRLGPGHWVEERAEAAHVLLNGAVDDPTVTEEALDAMLQ